MTDEQHFIWATAAIFIVLFICVTVVVVMR